MLFALNRRQVWTLTLAAAAVAAGLVLMGLVAPDIAAAATIEDVGKNTGAALRAVATALFLGVVAVLAIPHLLKRDFAGFAMYLAMALVVGWVVNSPDSVAASGRDMVGGLLQ